MDRTHVERITHDPTGQAYHPRHAPSTRWPHALPDSRPPSASLAPTRQAGHSPSRSSPSQTTLVSLSGNGSTASVDLPIDFPVFSGFEGDFGAIMVHKIHLDAPIHPDFPVTRLTMQYEPAPPVVARKTPSG